MVDQINPPQPSDTLGAKVAIGILWMLSLILVGYLGFVFGKDTKPLDKAEEKSSITSLVSPAPEVTSQVTPQVSTTTVPITTVACTKTGFAQKWDYLTPYAVKAGDTLPNIAATELHDAERINEITQINGVGPFVIGTTLYLPPPTITKSTGNIKQVHGKLIEKNATSWYLSFNDEKKGQGILIPTFWFEAIADRNKYKVGDCLTILFDEGFKVFTVSYQ